MGDGNLITDYDEIGVAAARSAVVEVVGALGAYRDQIVLVGGWVPEFILPAPADPLDRHPGSLDVDLALDHAKLKEAGYEKIEKLLKASGYLPTGDQPFQYFKDIGGVIVRVDLLAGEYGGTGKKHRTQKINALRARKARGCDLAFEIPPTEVEIEGNLPGGAKDKVRVRVATVVPFVVMKCMAISDRRKRKDPFDVWYTVRHYPGGVEALVKQFHPHRNHGLVREAIGIMTSKFETIRQDGPVSVAEFDNGLSAEEKEARQRDAFERMQQFLGRMAECARRPPPRPRPPPPRTPRTPHHRCV